MRAVVRLKAISSVSAPKADASTPDTDNSRYSTPADVVRRAGRYATPYQFGGKGDGTGDTTALFSLFDLSAEKGIPVFLPPGDWVLKDTYFFKPNQHGLNVLMHDDAVIRRGFALGPSGRSTLLGCFGSTSDKFGNIHLRGGTIANDGHIYGAANIFTLYHADGLIIDDVTMLDVVNNHAIDLAATNGARIRNSHFMGFNHTGGREYAEAIQLDNGALSLGTPTSSSDIVVEGNYCGPNPERTEPGWGGFGALIGNHDGDAGVFHRDIYVERNIVEGARYAAVRPYKWKNVHIKNNIFRNSSGRGVHFSIENHAGDGPSQDIFIEDNIIDVEGIGILIGASLPQGTDLVQTKNVVIKGNTARKAGGSYFASLQWIDGLEMTGNRVYGGAQTAVCNFVKNATIDNHSEGQSGIAVLFTEDTSGFSGAQLTAANALVGTGLTANLDIKGRYVNIASRAVQVNCAARNVRVGADMVDVASSGTVTAISFGGGVQGGFIDGCTYRNISAAGKPTIGISISSTCSNVVITPNNDFRAATVPLFNGSAGGYTQFAYAGSPEGAVTTQNGSICWDLTNGNQYIKTGGTNATGYKLVTRAP